MTTIESTTEADMDVSPTSTAEDVEDVEDVEPASAVDTDAETVEGSPDVQPEAARVVLTADELMPLIEALLFVADGPVEESALAKVLGVTRRQLDAPLTALGASLRDRGVRLQRGPEGAQLVTAPAAASYVEQFLGLEAARRLSPAALETLAIIAYRQPVTRATLEAIRGVSCDGPIDTLRTRGLIDVAGRADSPGRPTLFATTQKFLEHFGLERAEDLPELPADVAELAEALPERVEQLALDVVGAPASEDSAAAATASSDRTDALDALDAASDAVVDPEPGADADTGHAADVVDARPPSFGPVLPGTLGSAALPGASGPSLPPFASNTALPGSGGAPFGG